MTSELTPKDYLRLLEERVAGLRSLARGDRSLPIVPARSGEAWLVRRSDSYGDPGLFGNSPVAHKSFALAKGGDLDLFLRVRKNGEGRAEVASYRIAVHRLPSNGNNLVCLRFDKSQGQPRRDGWDEVLGDNPQHPWGHLHLNFDASQAANDLRLPTGEVDPIILLASFDHWYCSAYDV